MLPDTFPVIAGARFLQARRATFPPSPLPSSAEGSGRLFPAPPPCLGGAPPPDITEGGRCLRSPWPGLPLGFFAARGPRGPTLGPAASESDRAPPFLRGPGVPFPSGASDAAGVSPVPLRICLSFLSSTTGMAMVSFQDSMSCARLACSSSIPVLGRSCMAVEASCGAAAALAGSKKDGTWRSRAGRAAGTAAPGALGALPLMFPARPGGPSGH
mmetsp:Transcript_45440/g.144526  ORF Transcript_45440/g.144526 Transcript_45440/m.144526 type:complete len:214 (-) Transcript_45440:256-897(-)